MFDRRCCSDNDPKICMDCYERETKGRREAMDMLRDILNDGAKFEHAGEEHEFHADFDKATKMVTEYFANPSHHDGAAPAPSVDGVVQCQNEKGE